MIGMAATGAITGALFLLIGVVSFCFGIYYWTQDQHVHLATAVGVSVLGCTLSGIVMDLLVVPTYCLRVHNLLEVARAGLH